MFGEGMLGKRLFICHLKFFTVSVETVTGRVSGGHRRIKEFFEIFKDALDRRQREPERQRCMKIDKEFTRSEVQTVTEKT